jgi:hypothetical protein
MVRAWVALAWGLKAVDGLASTNKAGTPRWPSSLANIKPLGPPPTIKTGTCIMDNRALGQRGKGQTYTGIIDHPLCSRRERHRGIDHFHQHRLKAFP